MTDAPFAHQTLACELSIPRAEFALFMEMGTGKTRADIDDTVQQVLRSGMDGWLIVAPKGTYTNWPAEIERHLPPEIRRTVFLWAGGSGRGQESGLRGICEPAARGRLRIMVMNVEALSSSKRAVSAASRFLRSCARSKMTVDESTSIKNFKSNRTRECCRLGVLAAWRRILTGMPVTRSPLDVFGQFEFLRKGLLGFGSFYSFRNTYAITKEIQVGARRVKIVVNYRNLTDLQARVAKHSFRVTKEECLDLPPKMYQMRDAFMTEEQWRVYRSVRDDATAQLQSGDHVTATEVITQLLRLHQIVCGHVVDEAGVPHDLPCRRVEDLMDVLAETSGKVIVWCSYQRDVDRVAAAIASERSEGALLYGPASVVRYHGPTSTADRAEALQRFQGTADEEHDPACRFFVGNPATGGFGLTLTRATTVVYYSNSYSLEKRMQSEDRAHRIGQSSSVDYVDLVARDTVDEKIIQALRDGIDIASVIVGDGYREWLI